MAEKGSLKGAILQRDKQSYAIVPRIPTGVINPEQLRKLADVVEKHNIPVVKITSGQRLALVGMKEDQIEEIYSDLGFEPGKATELCLHYVQACPGTTLCKFGVQDALGFGQHIEELLAGRDFPAKLKVGVSGCPFTCAEGSVRDIGITGKKGGWTLFFGGHSGRQARIGDLIAEDLNDEELLALMEKCVQYYIDNSKKRERAARFIERIGIEEFKKQVLA